MAEKLSLPEIEIPLSSTKSIIVEEESIVDVSTINIGSVQICDDVVNQEASETPIHTIGKY